MEEDLAVGSAPVLRLDDADLVVQVSGDFATGTNQCDRQEPVHHQTRYFYMKITPRVGAETISFTGIPEERSRVGVSSTVYIGFCDHN